MPKESNFLIARVLAWPEAAREQLVRAIHEIEAQQDKTCSRPGEVQISASDQIGFIADAESEAYFKRNSFWF
jgi:hypothetical protein